MATYTGDQGGADLILANGDYIHSQLTNVGKFTVPAGATVYVTKWDGSAYGYVEVYAQNIDVAGTIDAQIAGYFGYSGGGGGGGGGGARLVPRARRVIPR